MTVAVATLVVAGLMPSASFASSFPAPSIAVSDAPVTRNQTVKLSIVQPGGYGITEYRISNEGTTSGGMLVTYVSVPERLDWYLPESSPSHRKLDWVLPDADGTRTIYAQVHYQTGPWSEVIHVDLVLDRSGTTSLYVDSDRAIENPLALWPTTDFHTRSVAPGQPVYASSAVTAKGNSLTVKDDIWGVTFTFSGAIGSGTYPVDNSGDAPCTVACAEISHLVQFNMGACTATSGMFTIHQITFAAGDVLTMTADFRVVCSWLVIAGSIRYGSFAETIALDHDVDFHDFGTVHVGATSATRTLTFTNIGDAAVQLGEAAFTGPGADDYETTADSCSNESLATDESCQIAVRVTPTTRGWRRIFLAIPDETARGARKVVFESTAVIPTSIGLTAPIVPTTAGPARFVITITPPPACEPELFIDGREYLSYTVQLQHNPERLDHIFDINELADGKHSVMARYQECGYYLASGPATISVAVGHDSAAPTGTVQINDGDEFTNDPWVYLITPAEDSESEMRHIAISNDGANWSTYEYSLHNGWPLVDTPGIHRVYVKFSDVFDNWSDVVSDTIVLDGVPPTVTAPAQEFVVGSSITDGKVRLRVPWSGDDNLSGVAQFDLNQKTDSGVWKDVPVAPTTAAMNAASTAALSATSTSLTVDRMLAPGHKYTFRVRATDFATNASGWAQGPGLNIKKVQEPNSRIRYQGSWKNASGTAYWGGGAKKATKAGATASLSFTGRAVAWVSRMGPLRGAARVYVDGVLVDTVDLYSPTARNKRVVWARSWGTAASHTVKIYVMGTPGRPAVVIDAFVTAE